VAQMQEWRHKRGACPEMLSVHDGVKLCLVHRSGGRLASATLGSRLLVLVSGATTNPTAEADST
jgi:hypothetical protein